MNLLFVCKFNRMRSVVSEAFFSNFNKNPGHKAKSAGLIKGSPISPLVKECSSEFGLKIKKEPEGLTSELLEWADIIVIVADNVPSSIFREPKKKKARLIRWEIRDVYSGKKKDIESRMVTIEGKVRRLVARLNKNNR